MAFEEDVFDVSFLVGATSLADYQYHFVKLSADNTVTVCTGATDRPIGILQNEPGAYGVARVRVMGVSRIYSGTAGIVMNTLVGTDSSGHGVAKTLDKAIYLGVALDTTTTTQTGTMILFPSRTISA